MDIGIDVGGGVGTGIICGGGVGSGVLVGSGTCPLTGGCGC